MTKQDTIALFLNHVENMTADQWADQTVEAQDRLDTENRRPNWEKARAAGADEHGVFLAGLLHLEAGHPGRYARVLRNLRNVVHAAAIEVVGFGEWYDANETARNLRIRDRKRNWVDGAIAEIQAGDDFYHRGMANGRRYIFLQTFGFENPEQIGAVEEMKLAA